MLTHNIKLAWRRLVKDGATSAMSIVSLSLGVACASIVFLIVKHEKNRDDFHAKGDRIFKVYMEDQAGGAEYTRLNGSLRREAGPMMETMITDAELLTRLRVERPRVIRGEMQSRRATSYVDPAFLKMFDFPVLHGSPSPLLQPHEAVITESLARKLVTDEDIASLVGTEIGILLRQAKRVDATIAAIVQTPPSNSSLQFEVLLPFGAAPVFPDEHLYRQMEAAIFVMFRAPVGLRSAQSQLDQFRDVYYAEKIASYRAEGRWTKPESPINLKLASLADMTKRDMSASQIQHIYPQMLRLLTVIGSLVLIAGCANFAIITIGRVMNKGKEIGIRKVSGARRWHLIRLSITESVLLSGVATAVGFALGDLLLPHIIAYIPFPNLAIGATLDVETIAYLAGMTLTVGCLAGMYPAYVISGLDAVRALAGDAYPGGRARLSRFLVVVQFAASLFLVTSTHIMIRQAAYKQTVDRGFDEKHVLAIATNVSDPGESEASARRFIQLAEQLPGVTHMMAANQLVGSWAGTFEVPESGTTLYHYRVDGDLLGTLGLGMKSGRYLLENGPVLEVVVNQRLVDHFGWDNPIGQTFPFKVGQIDRPIVVGVIEAFDFSTYPVTGPLVIHRDPDTPISRIHVRVRPETQAETYAKLKQVWREIAPAVYHQFNELDRSARDPFSITVMLETIGKTVSLFAMTISCLGLLGLAMQALARRTKEVGVRKVLGASIPSIFGLLSGRFIRLTAIGSGLGCVLSYFGMSRLVGGMSYPIPMTFDLFAIPAVGALIVAVGSVSYHTLRTARTDPTEELRYE